MFENFCRLAGMDPSQAINAIIRHALEQICEQGDPGLLISYLQEVTYRDQDEEAKNARAFCGGSQQERGPFIVAFTPFPDRCPGPRFDCASYHELRKAFNLVVHRSGMMAPGILAAGVT